LARSGNGAGRDPIRSGPWLAPRSRTNRARVLDPGHSDTVPGILSALGCRETVVIAREEYDNLWIVVPGQADAPVCLRLRF
jgi:hypothetical protein